MTAAPEAPGRAPGIPAEPTAQNAAGSKVARKVKTAPRTGLLALWDTSIGKKWVMAVTGLLMMAFLLVHMLGNLKIFYGGRDFDSYADYLRTIGTPILHNVWYLWIQRFVLLVAFILHIVAAAQLSARDVRARPVKYKHSEGVGSAFSKRKSLVLGSLKTNNMRYGGIFLLTFLIWHILDLSSGVVSPDKYVQGGPYENVVHDFHYWWEDVIYLVSMVALGFHINHGFWSASMTLGYNRPKRDKALKVVGSTLAVVIAGGFIAVPIAVMTGGLS